MTILAVPGPIAFTSPELVTVSTFELLDVYVAAAAETAVEVPSADLKVTCIWVDRPIATVELVAVALSDAVLGVEDPPPVPVPEPEPEPEMV